MATSKYEERGRVAEAEDLAVLAIGDMKFKRYYDAITNLEKAAKILREISQ